MRLSSNLNIENVSRMEWSIGSNNEKRLSPNLNIEDDNALVFLCYGAYRVDAIGWPNERGE